jgi:hypothetical protein
LLSSPAASSFYSALPPPASFDFQLFAILPLPASLCHWMAMNYRVKYVSWYGTKYLLVVRMVLKHTMSLNFVKLLKKIRSTKQ